jgi:hypothetical protein
VLNLFGITLEETDNVSIAITGRRRTGAAEAFALPEAIAAAAAVPI